MLCRRAACHIFSPIFAVLCYMRCSFVIELLHSLSQLASSCRPPCQNPRSCVQQIELICGRRSQYWLADTAPSQDLSSFFLGTSNVAQLKIFQPRIARVFFARGKLLDDPLIAGFRARAISVTSSSAGKPYSCACIDGLSSQVHLKPLIVWHEKYHLLLR